ncbi:MAG: GntR family transcriptional regulator [Streptosporangiaceae bacterium]|jgi:GntR family transcriptional regulator
MSNPMYRQIAEDLRDQIESGLIKPGAKLPTELELREHYDASRNTVRDAIKWLTTRGLVETRPGQGSFVPKTIQPYVTTLTTDSPRALGQVVIAGEGEAYATEVTGNKRTPSSSKPQVEIQEADGAMSAQLRIPEGTQVVSRHQRRFIDGTPWSLQTSFYPWTLAERAPELTSVNDIDGGAVRYLEKVLSIKQAGYSDWIIVRAPDIAEALFFGLPQDGRVAVFEISRTAFDQAGNPMRVTVTVFPTDRNQFIVNVGKLPPSRVQPDETYQET